jgi:hypothetical protein
MGAPEYARHVASAWNAFYEQRALRTMVAYLLAADNVSRPLLCRLREVNQPVIHTPNQFSSPRPRLLACL